MIDQKLKNKYPINLIIEGKVVKHMPFGLFVKFDEKEEDCVGLIQVTDIGKSEMWDLNQLPKIGEIVTVQVIAYTEDERNQIWLRPYEQ